MNEINEIEVSPGTEIYHIEAMCLEQKELMDAVGYFAMEGVTVEFPEHFDLFHVAFDSKEKESYVQVVLDCINSKVKIKETNEPISDYIIDEDSLLISTAYEVEFKNVKYLQGDRVADKVTVAIVAGMDKLKPFVLSTWVVPNGMIPDIETEYMLVINAFKKVFPGHVRLLESYRANMKLSETPVHTEIKNRFNPFSQEFLSKVYKLKADRILDGEIVRTMGAQEIMEYTKSGSDLTPQDNRLESLVKQLLQEELL